MHLFKKHYTRDEARALLPSVQAWLASLDNARARLRILDQKSADLLGRGNDLGGEGVNRWIEVISEIHAVFNEFRRREIQVKDLDRGLVDFPAFVGGKEALLCWERGEEDIEYWHDLDSGYAGREKL